MPEVWTRPATASDAEQLVELVLAMVAEINGPTVAPKLEPRLRDDVAAATRGDPDDHMLVAEIDGRLVGCGRARVLAHHPMLRFGLDPRYAYLELMYVVPEVRGSGVGGRILDELEAWVRHRGVTSVMLHYSPKARTLYERCGYAPMGEMHKRL